MSKSIHDLNDRQEYIGREMIEEYRAGHISRRAMLKTISIVCGAAGGSALLAACGDDEGAKMIADAAAGSPDAAMGSPDAAGGSPDAAMGSPDAAGGSPDAGAGADAAGPGPDVGPGVLSVPANDPNIEAMRIEYDSVPAAKIIAYLARPKAAGNYPGVVVIHENRGLNDHIRDVARRLAKAGFVALAPDLTSRGGSTEKLDPDMARAYLSMDGVADMLLADLNAGAEFLGKTMGVAPPAKLGVVGFCFGGGQTYRLAISNAKIAAAVPYYGPATPAVIATLKDSKAAFLIQHADNDMNVNSTRDMVRDALMMAGKTFEIVVHPNSRHAFNNDTGANYSEAAAVAAWTRTIDFFKLHLKQ